MTPEDSALRSVDEEIATGTDPAGADLRDFKLVQPGRTAPAREWSSAREYLIENAASKVGLSNEQKNSVYEALKQRLSDLSPLARRAAREALKLIGNALLETLLEKGLEKIFERGELEQAHRQISQTEKLYRIDELNERHRFIPPGQEANYFTKMEQRIGSPNGNPALNRSELKLLEALLSEDNGLDKDFRQTLARIHVGFMAGRNSVSELQYRARSKMLDSPKITGPVLDTLVDYWLRPGAKLTRDDLHLLMDLAERKAGELSEVNTDRLAVYIDKRSTDEIEEAKLRMLYSSFSAGPEVDLVAIAASDRTTEERARGLLRAAKGTLSELRPEGVISLSELSSLRAPDWRAAVAREQEKRTALESGEAPPMVERVNANWRMAEAIALAFRLIGRRDATVAIINDPQILPVGAEWKIFEVRD
ncbi:MAG: hypothetical protein D6719_09340 [Candidatus Dadabacteria bacterium]|nr:MAG: hypothetical protein D6719_09340 [Candidatus Dadabacteria bacterium]